VLLGVGMRMQRVGPAGREQRFAADRIESGDELLSIANGLALIGEQEDIDAWTVPLE
jgi:hypothetical protein